MAVAVALLLAVGRGQAGEPESATMQIVTNGKPAAVILLGRKATPTERHAAEELVRYVREMSDATICVMTWDEGQTGDKRRDAQGNEETAILIGRAETNPLIANLVRQRQVKLSAEDPGLDGFIIKTLTHTPAHPYSDTLILGGSRDRGTLYAVYHLLERFCHVGFFWDGDQVPRQRTLALPALDVSERPRFRERFSLSGCGCAGAYSYGNYWGFEDWRREIDWLAKNRFNTVLLTLGGTLVSKRADAAMGLKPSPVTDSDRRQAEIARQSFEHVRKLDLNAITPMPSTQVSEEFLRAHPEGRTFVSGWYVEDDAKQPLPRHLYPSDPLYRKWVETYVRVWNETYGSFHLYYGSDPYPEARFKTSDEERKRIQASLPVGVLEGLKAADPQSQWWLSGWAFTFDTGFWPKETFQAFLRNIAVGDALIWDLWCDEHPVYSQERANGFEGREFAFCILHEFGGDDRLRGDLAKVIQQAQAVAGDAKATNCVGFGLTTEVLHYNIIYYDLLAKLAWNPTPVGLGSFLNDYTVRRYGAGELGEMRPAVQALADSVLGAAGSSEARYQHRLYLSENPYRSLTSGQAVTTLAKLEQFLQASLRAVRPESAATNTGSPSVRRWQRTLQHDMVDVMRQYLTELFNLHLSRLEEAFAQSDAETFAAEAKWVMELLDEQETILSSRDDYRLEAIARRFERHPAVTSPAELRKWLRDTGLTFAVALPGIIDYQSKDISELLRFYYRPRLEAFIGTLREKLGRREFQVSHQELDDRYRPIELRWVNEGYESASMIPYTGTMWQAVREIFLRIQANGAVEVVRDYFKPKANLANGDFEDGLRGWAVRRSPGSDLQTTATTAASGRQSLLIRLSETNGVNKTVEAAQSVVSSSRFRVQFAYRIVRYTSLANGSVTVEGFDQAGRKVVQAVYPFGGGNWDFGNDKPEKTGGFYALNLKLSSDTGKWLQADLCPDDDVNRVHGDGTWEKLGLTDLRLSVRGWAYEGGPLSSEKNHSIEAFVDNVRLWVDR